MRERGGARRRFPCAVAVLVCAALAAPAGAAAATVVNGDFETGDLRGWQVHIAVGFGNWFAYHGTEAPIQGEVGKTKRGVAPVPAPPQGAFAAISDQLNPDTLVIYQDVALAPDARHQLSLETFYSSRRPLAVPTPDTLSVDEAAIGKQANQQYRIDLMRPEAPLESIAPGDVLRTIFRTMSGDPTSMPPTRITANLTPFAGQTVRLRVAVAAGKEALNAGIDAVSIDTTPLSGPAAGAGGKGGKKGAGAAGPRLRVLGRARPLANGRARLRVQVPGPGRLRAKRPRLLVPATATAARARTVTLRLKPTARAKRILHRRGKLRLRVALAFVPRHGATQRTSAPVLLRLRAPRRP